VSPETKKFLLRLGLCAVAGWIAGNWLLGPPGLSDAYMEANRHEHEHYVEIIKSHEYKLYEQRPHLVDLAADSDLADRVAFVQAYTASEDFQAEEHRRELYSLFFEFFNSGLVIVLAVGLGRAPLRSFLDDQIEAVREKLSQSTRSRKTAIARKAAAEVSIERLPETEMRVHGETERRLEKDLHELAEANHYSLGLQERELVERKKAAVHNAELAVKKRLVNAAIEELTARVQRTRDGLTDDPLLDDFLEELEAKR
jgi:ATP-dependent Clp protease ATP-binding subunit ClpA